MLKFKLLLQMFSRMGIMTVVCVCVCGLKSGRPWFITNTISGRRYGKNLEVAQLNENALFVFY